MSVAVHIGERFEREIRINRAGAVADQQAEVMRLAASPVSITRPHCVRVPWRIR